MSFKSGWKRGMNAENLSVRGGGTMMFINGPLIIVPPCSNGAPLNGVISRSHPVGGDKTPFFDDLASVGLFEDGPKSWGRLLVRAVVICNRCAGRCCYHGTYVAFLRRHEELLSENVHKGAGVHENSA